MMTDLIGRLSRRASKMRRALLSRVLTPQLSARAARSQQPLVDPANPVVVSLTSYGTRLNTVHLTIESIGRGQARPSRLILWTDPGVSIESLPSSLKRLRSRGLEILTSPEKLRSHTKYYPYVVSLSAHVLPLVTADDDSLYPRRWLSRLQAAAALHPHEIVCYRAHRVMLTPEGNLAPYNSWSPVVGTEASALNFATGVSGVHYPATFLEQLRSDGTQFLECCPRADDVWLHNRAVAHRRVIRQIYRRPRKYPEIAATQEIALHHSNTGASANDEQIAATYDLDAIEELRRAASASKS